MIINALKYNIYLGEDSFSQLNEFLLLNFSNSKIIVLVDENTNQYCFQTLQFHVDCLKDVEIIEVPSGESTKSLEICNQLWTILSEYNINRTDLLINLGGGVISDLGGFISSTYKRGISFLNIPTSLLSIVDASIGGKVGVDFNGLKNQIGSFVNPSAVFIIPSLLDTLPKRDLINGFAEVIKHALISDVQYFLDLKHHDFYNLININDIILKSIHIKNNIVLKDPYEKGIRKLLNFGHTIGHAIESHMLIKSLDVFHGEAIAIGICAESYISFKLDMITLDNLNNITELILKYFEPIVIDSEEFSSLLSLMSKDKKNNSDGINFTLLTSIGSSSYNNYIKPDLIIDSLHFINKL